MHFIIRKVNVGSLVMRAPSSGAVAQDNKREKTVKLAYYQVPFNTFNVPHSQRRGHAVIANNKEELCEGTVMVNDGSSPGAPSSPSSSPCCPQNSKTLRLYILPSSRCTWSPSCYLTWKKGGKKSSLC